MTASKTTTRLVFELNSALRSLTSCRHGFRQFYAYHFALKFEARFVRFAVERLGAKLERQRLAADIIAMRLERTAHGGRVGLDTESDAVFDLQPRILSQFLDVPDHLPRRPFAREIFRDAGVECDLRAPVRHPGPTVGGFGLDEQIALAQRQRGTARLDFKALPRLDFRCNRGGIERGQRALHVFQFL